MEDWFNDPFFKDDHDPTMDMRKHFAEVEMHMNNMMNQMHSIFNNDFGKFGLDYDKNKSRRNDDLSKSITKPNDTFNENYSNRYDSNSYSSTFDHNQTRRSSTKPIVEEPGETNPNNKKDDYFYSAAMTTITGPDGIQHSRKKTYDSKTGKTEMAEMRKLGDQAVAVKREIDRDGKIKDSMDRKNVDEKDVEDFRKRWDTQANKLSFGFHKSLGHSTNPDTKALK